MQANLKSDQQLKSQALQKLQRSQPAKLEVAGYYPLEAKQNAAPVPANLGGFGGGWYGGGGLGRLPAGGAF